jgi:hypothetical protein
MSRMSRLKRAEDITTPSRPLPFTTTSVPVTRALLMPAM